MNVTFFKYNYLKVKELKMICKQNKIKGYSKLRKKELVDLIIKNLENTKQCVKCEKDILNKNYITYDDNTYQHIECYNIQHSICYEEHDCSICFDKILKKDEYITECNHYFHKNCIGQWENMIDSRNKCPNCRQKIKEPLSYKKIHNEIVKKSDELLEEDQINDQNNLEFDNLFYQTTYIDLLFLKKKFPNADINTIMDYFYNNLEHSLQDLFTRGLI